MGTKLWIMPACWGLPNASPFVVKVQAWLRMADIPHETLELRGPARSATGKVPYLDRVLESSNLVAYCERLREEFFPEMTAALPEARRQT